MQGFSVILFKILYQTSASYPSQLPDARAGLPDFTFYLPDFIFDLPDFIFGLPDLCRVYFL